jgi:hypothetical protein
MTALRLQNLIEESANLESRARAIQGARDVRVDENHIDELVSAYHEWYAQAVDQLPDDLEERFRNEFESGFFKSSKIQDFLTAPGMPSVIQPDEPSPLLSYWQHPFESAFRAPLLTQRQILAGPRSTMCLFR